MVWTKLFIIQIPYRWINLSATIKNGISFFVCHEGVKKRIVFFLGGVGEVIELHGIENRIFRNVLVRNINVERKAQILGWINSIRGLYPYLLLRSDGCDNIPIFEEYLMLKLSGSIDANFTYIFLWICHNSCK